MDKHLDNYNAALNSQNFPESTKSVPKYATSSSETGITGFQDLKPANPEVQARYDAMSGSWEGVEASNKANFKGSPSSTK